MENMVSKIFDDNNITYRKEVYSKEWTDIKRVLGDDEKRFDFVIEAHQKTYLIEVNFYSGGGSKLNEVARAYTDIAPKVNSVPNFESYGLPMVLAGRMQELNFMKHITSSPASIT